MKHDISCKEWLIQHRKILSFARLRTGAIKRGYSPDTVRKILNELNIQPPANVKSWSARPKAAAPAVKETGPIGIPTEAFLSKLDLPRQIKDYVRNNLKKCFMPEMELREALKANMNRFKRLAESPDFEEFRIKYGDKWYWSAPENIRKAHLTIQK